MISCQYDEVDFILTFGMEISSIGVFNIYDFKIRISTKTRRFGDGRCRICGLISLLPLLWCRGFYKLGITDNLRALSLHGCHTSSSGYVPKNGYIFRKFCQNAIETLEKRQLDTSIHFCDVGAFTSSALPITFMLLAFMGATRLVVVMFQKTGTFSVFCREEGCMAPL